MSDGMRWMCVLAAVGCCGLLWAPGAMGQQQLTAELQGNRIAISVAGEPFTNYKFAEDQKYPYFYPVIGPLSGESVTTESSEPYPHHHSLFFGCDKVNGGNYWQDKNKRGQIISEGPKVVKAEGDRVAFTDVCMWRIPGKDPVIRDLRTVIISAPSETIRIIDFEIRLAPVVDVQIAKTNHSLFAARVAPELSTASGGTLVNAEGLTGEEATFGVASPWCDYYGAREGKIEGLAILQHPENPWYPSKWFTRDYGFISPTPMFWPADGATRLHLGQVVQLRYRVVVHAGDTKEAGIAELFAEYK